jgi:nicotinamide riboside kinase
MMKTRIVLSGPESSGKSTLAAALAARLGLPMAPEYARAHLEAGNPAPQTAADLTEMARHHLAWQLRHVPADAPVGILDTGMLNYHIWADVAFGHVPGEIANWLADEAGHIHLLCEPDLPWQPDPLRECPHPAQRQALFDRHLAELARRGTRVFRIHGSGEARLAMAEAACRAIMQHMAC